MRTLNIRRGAGQPLYVETAENNGPAIDPEDWPAVSWRGDKPKALPPHQSACKRCGETPAWSRGLCSVCAKYEDKHDRVRTQGMIAQARAKKLKRQARNEAQP